MRCGKYGKCNTERWAYRVLAWVAKKTSSTSRWVKTGGGRSSICGGRFQEFKEGCGTVSAMGTVCRCDCWRGSGVYSSILCISVTSWSECFFLEIRWLVFIMGLKSHRSRAVSVWSFTFLSEITKKTQLWGQLGHLHVASFQTCSTKRGKLTSGPCEIEYIPSRQNHWNDIILQLHQDDFTQYNRTLLIASDWDLNSDFSMSATFLKNWWIETNDQDADSFFSFKILKKFIIQKKKTLKEFVKYLQSTFFLLN